MRPIVPTGLVLALCVACGESTTTHAEKASTPAEHTTTAPSNAPGADLGGLGG